MTADGDGAGAVLSSKGSEPGPKEESAEALASTMLAMWERSGGGGINPDVAKKVTSEHIGQALKNADKGQERWIADRKDERRAGFWVSVLVILSAVSVIFLLVLTSNEAILSEHLDAVIASLVAGVAGYGFGESRSTGGRARRTGPRATEESPAFPAVDRYRPGMVRLWPPI